jgi:histidine triad (HIT) family protein
MDVFPRRRGHLLMIPKNSRARNLLDAEPAVVATLFQATQRLAKAVRAALKPDGLTIIQYNGAEAGQTVYHLHVHIIPRWAGETAGTPRRGAWPMWRALDDRRAALALVALDLEVELAVLEHHMDVAALD